LLRLVVIEAETQEHKEVLCGWGRLVLRKRAF